MWYDSKDNLRRYAITNSYRKKFRERVSHAEKSTRPSLVVDPEKMLDDLTVFQNISKFSEKSNRRFAVPPVATSSVDAPPKSSGLFPNVPHGFSATQRLSASTIPQAHQSDRRHLKVGHSTHRHNVRHKLSDWGKPWKSFIHTCHFVQGLSYILLSCTLL